MSRAVGDAPTTAAPACPTRLATVALRLIAEASAIGVRLRLCGGLAVWFRCGDAARRFSALASRRYSDFDLAAYYTDRERVGALLREGGFREELETATVPGTRRAVFSSAKEDMHGDVSYDGLDFCHHIDLRGRLELDGPTLPLAELLLQKLQIVDLTSKDVIDIQMLLCDFDFASSDREGISAPRLSSLCGSDWGLFHTTALTIAKIEAASDSAPYLDADQRRRVRGQLERLGQLMAEAPKSLRWRLRAFVGDRVRWYETVETAR